MRPAHAVYLHGSRFWVMHRRRTYGPFDYEWSPDFCGVALLYNGEKFGEFCTREELYADLSVYRLPMTVVEVTSIVMGCVLWGVMHGLTECERAELLQSRLSEFGYPHFHSS